MFDEEAIVCISSGNQNHVTLKCVVIACEELFAVELFSMNWQLERIFQLFATIFQGLATRGHIFQGSAKTGIYFNVYSTRFLVCCNPLVKGKFNFSEHINGILNSLWQPASSSKKEKLDKIANSNARPTSPPHHGKPLSILIKDSAGKL